MSIIIITKDDPDVVVTIKHIVAQMARSVHRAELVIVAAGDPPDVAARWRDGVRWVPFDSSARKATIPEQRNVGMAHSQGDVIVFIDSGCVPCEGWLDRLVQPVFEEREDLVAGAHVASGPHAIRDDDVPRRKGAQYLTEAPTINLAITRRAIDAVGAFDESFGYGSDVDLTWRAADAGYRIRFEPAAVVTHDWGSLRRDLRRSWVYGGARFALYAKHRSRRRLILRRDPVAIIYPAYLTLLPATRFHRLVIVAGLAPLVKNWRHRPFLTTAHNYAFGAGFLTAAGKRARGRLSGGRRRVDA
ncbi:MAG: glycosyltransferase [Solirubrobacteraceae bacterium]